MVGRGWKILALVIVTVLFIITFSSFNTATFHPILKALPDIGLKSYSESLEGSENLHNDDAFTDEDLQEAEAELSKSEALRRAIHLTKELQEAKKLYEEVRILCWVLMYPGAHNKTTVHIKATWGRRCNRLIFMSTKDDPSVGAIDVGSREGYTKLWNKTRCALKYIYNNILYDYDWFLKADSDTYVLVDNLRYVLRAYNTDDPIYFGQFYKAYGRYNTGGAGHVMGREAVRRFVERSIPNSTICKPERSKGEDVGMGNCLQKVGIKFGDTRDHLGQGRFWQRHPTTVMENPLGRQKISFYPVTAGDRPDTCCSDTLISFHKLTIPELYLLDYLIYKVRVFGHLPALPLRVPLPPDLKAVPEGTMQKYRKYTESQLRTTTVIPTHTEEFIDLS